MKAVIQAGGQGTRLRPYTLILPKPLMPVGGIPVIELLLKWLRRNGTTEAFITTGYLGHLLTALCGDGRQWDMNISYSEEPEPLGTVGALRLLEKQLTETFLVLNGDLITDLDVKAFKEFHDSHGGLLTIGITTKIVNIDLGVLDLEGHEIVGFHEKPTLKYQVSMGMYCMNPEIMSFIPTGVPFGVDNLIHSMLDKKEEVHAYQHDGMWMDIGRPEDFQKAQEMFEENKQTMLGF